MSTSEFDQLIAQDGMAFAADSITRTGFDRPVGSPSKAGPLPEATTR
jgi:hypothetical protein